MGSILCVHLEESRIISLLVQKSESGIGYETHCERCIPLSSLCFLESGEQKFVFGFDTTHFADIIPNSCVLQSPEEFLQQPLLFAENNMSPGEEPDSNKVHLPLYYLLTNLRNRYMSWCSTSLDTLVLCCSLDLFISYSFLIEECAKDSGFSRCHIIDSTSLLGYSCSPTDNSKCHFLILETGNSNSFCLSLSVSPNVSSFPNWEECSFLSSSSIISRLQNTQFASSSSDVLYDSLLKLRTQYESNGLSQSDLTTQFQLLKDDLASVFSKCLSTRNLEFQDVNQILISGELANISLLYQIQRMYPHIPAVILDSSSIWREGFLRFCSMVFRFDGSDSYIGEMEGNVPSGYGEQFRLGECIYRGFFQNGVYEGIGECFEANQPLYRGQFHQGYYSGKGVLHLSDEEIIRGQFSDGVLIDGNYDTYYPDGSLYYSGGFKRGMRNGVGKEYSKEGKVIFDGCFQDGLYCGLGRLFLQDGSYIDGRFENGKLEGEASKYRSDGHLCSVATYREGKPCGTMKEFDKQGYLFYEGGWNDYGYFGKGVMYYPGGRVHYDGEFLNGSFNGYGQLYNMDGDLIYIGEFQQGKYEGEGKEYTENTLLLYTGEFHQGNRHGNGKLFFSEGHYYEGNFSDGTITGKGKMVWSDGEMYEGEFKNGKKNGMGKFVWSDASWYEGEFQNDQRNGKGKQFDSEGRLVYEGEWKEGHATGHGKLYFLTGCSYEGEVVNGKRVGSGKQLNEKGEIEYEGEWENDVPHGYGVYYYTDGNVYNGQWVNGEKEGTGRLTYKDGNYYIGLFKGGVRHGKGCLVNKQGKIMKEYLS